VEQYSEFEVQDFRVSLKRTWEGYEYLWFVYVVASTEELGREGRKSMKIFVSTTVTYVSDVAAVRAERVRDIDPVST
jgi:hypothetical protein